MAQKRIMVIIPDEMMDEIIRPRQRRIYEETGEWRAHPQVARELIERGHACDSQECHSLLSSGAN